METEASNVIPSETQLLAVNSKEENAKTDTEKTLPLPLHVETLEINMAQHLNLS